MDPAPTTLPVHEFPEGPVLLGDWRSAYRSATVGQMLLRDAGPVGHTISRMHHIHVSKIRWYSSRVPLNTGPSQLRTFELASGSQWEGPPDNGNGRLGQFSPPEHEHHFMIAEISLSTPIPSNPSSHSTSPPSLTHQDTTTVLGYLRVDGTCQPDGLLPDSDSTSNADHPSTATATSNTAATSSTHLRQGTPRRSAHDANRLSTSTLNVSLDEDYIRSRISNAIARLSPEGGPSQSFFDRPYTPPSPIPMSDLLIPYFPQGDDTLSSPLSDIGATPIARHPRRSGTEGTPTRGRSYDSEDVYGSSSFPAPSFFDSDIYASGSQDATASNSTYTPFNVITQEPDVIDAAPVSGRLDLSYLDRRPSSSSPLFISPFASRSNSVSPSPSSTGNTSQGTRPNSRSNSSSNATSFSASSSVSLSSAGLVFSNNRLDRDAESEREATFVVVSYAEGFPKDSSVQALDGRQSDECVLELTFPVKQESDDGPQSFLTLCDLTILVDLVGRSLKSTSREMMGTTVTSDSSSESAASDAEWDSDSSSPSAISIVTPAVASTCCCEFYKRLFALIPLVSGLRVPSEGRPSGVQAAADPAAHYKRFSHHGRYLRAAFEDDDDDEDDDSSQSAADEWSSNNDTATSIVARKLKAKFERKRARFDRELLLAARSVNRRASSTAPVASRANSNDPPVSSNENGPVESPSPMQVQCPTSWYGNLSSPVLALEEARRATEMFCEAVRRAEAFTQPSSTSSDEDVENDA